MELPEPRDQLETLVHPDHLVFQDQEVHQVHKVTWVHPVSRVTKVFPVPLESKVTKDQRENKEKWV